MKTIVMEVEDIKNQTRKFEHIVENAFEFFIIREIIAIKINSLMIFIKD